MKVLHIAAGLPSEERPFHQPFIQSQIESLTKAGIETDVFEIKGYNSKTAYFKAIKEIKEKVSEKNYNIIHSHYSYCGLASYWAKTGKPIVLSLMGSDLLGSPNIQGRMTLRGKFDKLLSKYIYNKVNHLIVKSERMRNEVKTKIPISVVPNGVNLDFFKPMNIFECRKNLSFNNNEFLILFLGNPNEPRKNFILAKQAAELFKEKHSYGEETKIITPFGISQTKIVTYMNAADVLLLTSYWEGSPNVIKEAMSCNLPIISVDVGDVKERINGASNCFIVNYSKEEISKKLEIIYENEQRSNGREMVADLSSDKIARKIIDIYYQVLKVA